MDRATMTSAQPGAGEREVAALLRRSLAVAERVIESRPPVALRRVDTVSLEG